MPPDCEIPSRVENPIHGGEPKRLEGILKNSVSIIPDIDGGNTMPTSPPRTAMIDSTNATLFTIAYPRQNAESVILLHGGPGVPMDFTPIPEHLSSKYQVIAFDQRGTGRSPAKHAEYSMTEYLEDVDAVAQNFHLAKFHLFGHSWGGLLAQIYAERNPQNLSSLFLSSPSSGTGQIWKQTENEVLAFNKQRSGILGFSKMAIGLLFGILGSDTAYQRVFKQVLETYNKDFDPTFKATDAMVENVRAEPINKTRPQILKYPLLKDAIDYGFPVMVTYGEKDIYGRSKEHVRSRFPKATFAGIENAGHIPWRHNKGRFFGILNDFYKLG